MRITNWMTQNPVCVRPTDSLAWAAALMATGGFRQIPVVEEDRLVGIITDRDLRQNDPTSETVEVAAAMTTCPITIDPSDTAENAARIIIERKIGALPVVENGRVVGIVTTSDLLKALLSIVRATQDIVKR